MIDIYTEKEIQKTGFFGMIYISICIQVMK